MVEIKGLTAEQNAMIEAAWKALDETMQPLHDTHTDTLGARDKAESAWDDFFSLCDAYDTDRLGAYFTCSIYA